VRFVTTESSFPAYLEAGVDTLRLALHVDSTTGVQPYRFSARVATAGLMLLNGSASNLLVWAPDTTMLGQQQLVVVVHDDLGDADTLYPRILVVMPNRPCSLSVSFRSPVMPNGAANLNSLARPDTFLFVIEDPDDPKLERHSITLYQARTRTLTQFDSTATDTFRVVFDAQAFDGYDTLTAMVTDQAGHRDTLVQHIYYGAAPQAPMLLSPTIGATGVLPPVDLQWQCSDPDADALAFDVYVGTSPVTLNFIASTTSATCTLPVRAGATTYYWQIRARDWKRTVPSSTFSFSTP